MLPSPTDSAGQSSAPSSLSPSSLRQRDSASSMSTAPTSHSHHVQVGSSEGNHVNGGQEGVKGRRFGERARGLMGGFGIPRGPPPTNPPPLPPPEHPQAGPSRPGVFTRTSNRLSTNPLRQSSLPAPSYPPPTSALPQPPSSYTSQPPPAPSATISRSLATAPIVTDYGRHQRQDSSISYRSTASSSTRSIPPSPTTSGPPISPRTSSLTGRNHTLPTPAVIPEVAESSTRSRRVPSRQLLQTALDLAQHAVELDQGNDVLGALEAYREAVTRLRAVMERVGVEGRQSRTGKAEEEGRTLKGIHDAYVARIELLQSYEGGEEAIPDNSLTAFPAPPKTQPTPDTRQHFPSTQPRQPEPELRPPDAPIPDPIPHGTTSITPVSLASDERTPRPSLDASESEGHGIGDFMLADQSFEPFTPDRPDLDQTPQPAALDTPSRPSRNSTAESLATGSRRSIPLDYGISTMEAGSTSTVVLNESSPSTLISPPPRRESLSSAAIGLGHPISPPRFDKTSQTPLSTTSSDLPDTPVTPRRHRRQNPSIGLEDEIGLTRADGLLDKEEVEEIMDGLEQTPNGIDQRSRSGSIDKTLPPLPPAAAAEKPQSTHSRQSSLGRLGQLISETTSRGTISQRRLSRNSPNLAITTDTFDSPPSLPSSKSMAFGSRLPNDGGSSSISHSGSRSRSKSQPGHRPDTFLAESADDVPPLPDLRKKPSFPSNRQNRVTSDNLAPPRSTGSYRSVSPSSIVAPDTSSALSFSGSLISPIPELQPQDALHRPFHLLRTLHTSMDPEGPGAYLTGAIHIPSSIWSSGSGRTSKSSGLGLRITAQDVKVRIMDALLLHLEIIRHTGAPLLEGPREVMYGVPGVAAPRMGASAVAGIGQELLGALDGLEEEMDVTYRSLTKAGVVVGGWKGKKASTNNRSWGSKVVRSMDKMTSSKAMDSPDRYVDLLASLCLNIQILNDHLSNFTGPCTPAYHYIAEPGFRALEQRLTRSAEFVRMVLIPFVLDDFKQFFYRYLKGGMRYIED